MTTIRVARRHRFTSIDRRTINDHTLSFRARGVLVWLLDKPDDWHSTSIQIAREGREGRDAVRAALTELENAGYLARTHVRDARGRWSTEIVVHEVPVSPGLGIRHGDGQDTGPRNPASEDQAVKPPKTVTEDCATNIASDTQDACRARKPEVVARLERLNAYRASKNTPTHEGAPTP